MIKDISVLFIVQAGKKHGIGHLKRCLQIADLYTKPFIWVISDLNDTSSLGEILSHHNHQISTPSHKISVSDILAEYHFDLIVSDCANISKSFVSSLNNCPLPMISLDNIDLGACSEVFISPLPYHKTKSANFSDIYHCPIDEKFFLEPTDNQKISKVLISLGGSDPRNNAEKIIKALKDQPYDITLIAGPLSNYKLEGTSNVTIKRDVSDLFPFIKENDLIFCGPGLTLLESLAAKKHVIVVAHTHKQYKDLSTLQNIQTLYTFINEKNIKKAITKSTSGKLQLPEGFNFKEWFSQLSYTIADRPAFCPLCGSYDKHSILRSDTQNQYKCNSCNSHYIYNLDPQVPQIQDEIIANNSEQEQISYKQAVLIQREDSNRRVQIIKKILPAPTYPYTLMDIGAEHGIFVQEAKHNGFSSQGVELSVFARKVALDNHNIEIIDSMDKVYDNGSVNQVVTIWKKLELLENPTEYLKKISSLLPIGGMLAFRVPVVESNTPISRGFFRITEKGGKFLAEQSGFSAVQVAKYTNEYGKNFLEFYCIKRYNV